MRLATDFTPRNCGPIPGRDKKNLFSKLPRPVLKPIQHPVERVAGDSFPRGSGRGLNLTARLHLVTKLRTSGAVLPLPYSILVVHQDTFTSYLFDKSVGGLTAGLGNVEHKKSLLLSGMEIRLSSPSLSFTTHSIRQTGMNINRHAVP